MFEIFRIRVGKGRDTETSIRVDPLTRQLLTSEPFILERGLVTTTVNRLRELSQQRLKNDPKNSFGGFAALNLRIKNACFPFYLVEYFPPSEYTGGIETVNVTALANSNYPMSHLETITAVIEGGLIRKMATVQRKSRR